MCFIFQVPFRYEWLDETFKEMATFVFFVMTGYKFRPASNNPYFSVPTDEYDMEEVLIGGTAINEQVRYLNSKYLFCLFFCENEFIVELKFCR